MTSAVGGGRGFPKSRQKEQNQLISDSDTGAKNSNILRMSYIYGSPLARYKEEEKDQPISKFGT